MRLLHLGAMLLFPVPLIAATIHVPSDQPSIQAGVNAASSGDSVVVACGTYFESFIVMKSGVVLRSATGSPDCVTVDAERKDRVFHCQGMNSATKIEGFTIQNGLREASGGLWCVFSSMTIERCNFQDNEVTHDAGAIGLFGASPIIRDCTFLRNHTSDALRDHNRGGAIYMQTNCSPVIEGCTFIENRAFLGGGIWCNDLCTPVIRDCAFFGNQAKRGGGVSIEGNSTFLLDHCLFVENVASIYGGGLFLNSVTGDVTHCTVFGNSSSENGGQVFAAGTGSVDVDHTIIAFGQGVGGVVQTVPSVLHFGCTDIFGNVGGDWVGNIAEQAALNDNFSLNPLFCDSEDNDFTIRSNSPCAPPGATGCGLVGAAPVSCGPVSIQPVTWAHIKAKYR